ncbi:MAG TPA: RNA polymerase sigma factor [Polyangiales bacterium]|nr:RNA polymerase sigma factor [Polyangiales bacterium]
MSSEQELVERLRRGESAAFDAIYDQHRARIFSFLARLTGRRELAEELVQEVFLRLCRFAPRLAPDTQIALWLYTVARNLARSHYRWSAVDADRLLGLAQLAEAERQVSPFDMTAAREVERAVERALQRLPIDQRELLILIVVERVPSADAARVLGLSAVALRQRLSRARKLLASAIAREGVDPTCYGETVSDDP